MTLHTQGVPAWLVSGMEDGGITPAYAGSTVSPSFNHAVPGDYPCIRREYGRTENLAVRLPGLPLHTQGVLTVQDFSI